MKNKTTLNQYKDELKYVTIILICTFYLPLYSDDICDPINFAKQMFSSDFGIDIIKTYEKDLDLNGTNELLVYIDSFSKMGYPHIVFEKLDTCYSYVGYDYIRKEFLSVGKFDGDSIVKVATYYRNNDRSGSIVWLQLLNGKLLHLEEEHVEPGDNGTDAGNKRMKEIFGN